MHIELKSPAQIALMREAGRVVARTMRVVADAAAPGVRTRDLDDLAAQTIAAHGATSNFLGYGADVGPGFPGVICTSVNDEVIHGIPGERVLRDGDLLSIDCGAVVDGWHADAAITVAIGDVPPEFRQLIDVTEQALQAGIAAMASGRRVRDISSAVAESVRGHGSRFGIVRGYTGHGIGSALHQDPDVPNVAGRRRTPGWSRGWCSPSNRWSCSDRPTCGRCRTSGRCGPSTDPWPPTSSTPWPEPTTGWRF